MHLLDSVGSFPGQVGTSCVSTFMLILEANKWSYQRSRSCQPGSSLHYHARPYSHGQHALAYLHHGLSITKNYTFASEGHWKSVIHQDIKPATVSTLTVGSSLKMGLY
jgi:hypothetical protein